MKSNNKYFPFIKIKISAIFAAGIIVFSPQLLSYNEAFPADEAPYVSGPASANLDWQGENFEDYQNGDEIECDYSKLSATHFDVTSGCLSSKYAGNWRRGWTQDSVFRVLTIARDSYERKIKWTNQIIEYRGYVKEWHKNGNIPDWSGLHAFARYRTSDDLYVASLRYDGYATIKRKWNGTYTTLAKVKIDNEYRDYLDSNGNLKTGKWYRLKFSAIGNKLNFYLDETLILSTENNTFSWGTTGIRTDNADMYIDDWKLLY